MKHSFTILEIVFVLILLGIISTVISFKVGVNKLNIVADEFILNFRYAQSLALKDDKYYPFNNGTTIEANRSKYWFKQWWHIKLTDYTYKDGSKHMFYYIFSDSPTSSSSTTFDKRVDGVSQYSVELAKNYEGKYLIGASKDDASNSNDYPSKNEMVTTLDLTKMGVRRVEFTGYSASSMSNSMGNRVEILFDNFGNIFLREGDSGDAGDTNPLDFNERKLLTNNVILKFCKYTDSCNSSDREKCIAVEFSPSGNIFKRSCIN